MKILFFIALLANIVFFLWEFNSGALNSEQGKKTIENKAEKQILLLSELSEIDQEKGLIVAENNLDIKKQIASEELNKTAVIESEEKIEKSIEIKVSNLTEVTKIEDSALVKESQIEQLEDSIDHGSLEQEDNKIIHEADTKENRPDTNNEVIVNVVEKEEIKPSSDTLNEKEPTKKQSELLKTFCYQVGPFQDQNALDVWKELNEFKAASLRQINEEKQVVSGYLVHYPAEESFEKSEENVEILKRMGVKDVWLFRDGELKGVISMGLFRNEKGAQSVHEKFVNMGLDVKIMQRYKTESVLYLQISTLDETFKDTMIVTEKQGLAFSNTK